MDAWRGMIPLFLHSIYHTFSFRIKSKIPELSPTKAYPGYSLLFQPYLLVFSSFLITFQLEPPILESFCLWPYLSLECSSPKSALVSPSVFMSLLQSERRTLIQLFKMSPTISLPTKCALSFLIAFIIYLVLAYCLSFLEEYQPHESRGLYVLCIPHPR